MTITLTLVDHDWDQLLLGAARVDTVAVAATFAPHLREHITDLGLRTITDLVLDAAGEQFTGRGVEMIVRRAQLNSEAGRLVHAGRPCATPSALAAQALARLLHGLTAAGVVGAEKVLGGYRTLTLLLTGLGCEPDVADVLAEIVVTTGALRQVGAAASWLRHLPARPWLVREVAGNPAHSSLAGRYVALLAAADAEQPFTVGEIDVAVGLMRHLDPQYLVGTIRSLGC